MTLTARTLARLRRDGALAAVVERWNPHARVRQDLFGFADVLAVVPGCPGVLAIQACAATDAARRRAKVRAAPAVRPWLEAGNRVEVWAWAKRGPRGRRKTWQASVADIGLAELDGR